jgi:hypothetical protein
MNEKAQQEQQGDKGFEVTTGWLSYALACGATYWDFAGIAAGEAIELDLALSMAAAIAAGPIIAVGTLGLFVAAVSGDKQQLSAFEDMTTIGSQVASPLQVASLPLGSSLAPNAPFSTGAVLAPIPEAAFGILTAKSEESIAKVVVGAAYAAPGYVKDFESFSRALRDEFPSAGSRTGREDPPPVGPPPTPTPRPNSASAPPNSGNSQSTESDEFDWWDGAPEGSAEDNEKTKEDMSFPHPEPNPILRLTDSDRPGNGELHEGRGDGMFTDFSRAHGGEDRPGATDIDRTGGKVYA